jgi:L-ribulose-5-phosphate 3-epimerase
MMSEVKPLEIGVCTWSLRTWDAGALQQAIKAQGLHAVHLGLGDVLKLPVAQQAAALDAYRRWDLAITATMIHFVGEDYSSLANIHRTGGYVPDDLFELRLKRTVGAAKLSKELGVPLLTTHAGFIPTRADAAAFNIMIARLARVADALAPLGITLCFETGQETATTLAEFLIALNRPNIGVNFDPANMILYGKGDPVAAVATLAPWIKHVHAKDARKKDPGSDGWCGIEVPVGAGDARVREVVQTLKQLGYRGAIAIEREVGTSQAADIATAVRELKVALGSPG